MFKYATLYDSPPYRPPNEAYSALIRITRGCPWNKCEFCSMYKNVKFEIKTMEEVQEDVRKARLIYRDVHTIFLGDSDNLVHRNLPEIISFIRKTFPESRRITAYARAKTVLRKKMDFLKKVREAGLDRLHIGFESGDALVLRRLCKGATPEEMIEGGSKAREAGFETSFYVLSGAGGFDRWREHALHSADVLNKIGPDFIRLRTLTIQNGTPLKEKQRRGEFVVTRPLDRLKEVHLFIAKLNVEECFVASDHLTNYLWAGGSIIYKGVGGHLPHEKKRMLDTLRQSIARIQKSNAAIRDANQLYEEGLIDSL